MKHTVKCLGLVLPIMMISLPALAQEGSLWQEIQDRGSIRCGSMTAFSPGSWKVDGPAQYEGTSINFCREIAADLSKDMNKELTVEFVDTTWSTVVLDIQSARIDLFVGLNTSEERRRALDLTGPAYDLPDCVVAGSSFQAGDTWESLNKPEFTFATLSGSNSERTFKEALPAATVLGLKQQAEAILAVQSGRANAYGVGLVACVQVYQASPEVFSRYVIPQPYHSTPSMAGTRKDSDGKLAAWVQKWMDEKRAAGAIKDIMFDGWLKAGMDVSLLPADLNL